MQQRQKFAAVAPLPDRQVKGLAGEGQGGCGEELRRCQFQALAVGGKQPVTLDSHVGAVLLRTCSSEIVALSHICRIPAETCGGTAVAVSVKRSLAVEADL